MSQLIFPPGYKAGCLPRQDRCGERMPLFSEHIKVIPQQEWADVIGEIDLSSMVVEGIDQLRVGSCSCASLTQGVKIVRQLMGQPHVGLNHEFIYHTTSGGRDQGSVIGDNIVFAREHGIAPLSVWPRTHSWTEEPSEEAIEAAKDFLLLEAYDASTIDEVGTGLIEGFPVVFGWSGHSCVFTDILSLIRGKYRNSWGDNWGTNGFGELPFSSINFKYGCHILRTATVKVTP